MNSLRFVAGTDGCTTSISGIEVSSLIATKSLIGSKGCFCNPALIAKAMVVTSSVWPSGAALATAAVPIMLPPPGRLFTIVGRPTSCR